MGILQIRQIKNHLDTLFTPLVDANDLASRANADASNATLSRALAAFALSHEADIEARSACSAITDGFNDNGIDAIYYSLAEKNLYIIQSKWSADGSGSISLADTLKFITGVKDLLSGRFDRFNEKVRGRQTEINDALNDTLRITLVIVYSGSDTLSTHVKSAIDEFIDEQNDTGEIAFVRTLSQETLYAILTHGAQGAPINIDIQMFDWGQKDGPIQAFYGQVSASDVAQWWVTYHPRLFAKNIRMFLGANTSVNDSISQSLRNRPELFWYLNNGITALCNSIRKRVIGGNTRESGLFECRDVTIVNGAQTVGSIATLLKSNPSALNDARVTLRLISLENCPPNFALDVTRATNTQNRVDARNFVALDPEQERLRNELQLEGVDYEIRQGEIEGNGPKKFGLVEATVALACSYPTVEMCVQAKREISKLWEDITARPYKALFRPKLTGIQLWNTVQILRIMDEQLDAEKLRRSGREANLMVHGNRLIQHLAFLCSGISSVVSEDYDIVKSRGLILENTKKIVKIMQGIVENEYADSYLASLFKNLSKCKDIAEKTVKALAADSS